MTNVRRPFHLQLRPTGTPTSNLTTAGQRANSPASLGTCMSPKALSPTSDSLPSQIVPYLFVGNQDQTNRETINRLNIHYILSLGQLPMISTGAGGSPSSPAKVLMPSQDCSKDFKIRISSAGNTGADSQHNANGNNTTGPATRSSVTSTCQQDDENKAVKPFRSIRCKCINISDNSDQLLTKFFDEAHAFIDEARRKKCNILVHCLAGISRSPTFAIAYLMRVKSLHWRDAYDLVKRCRPQIDPNLSFMAQLRIYNRTLTSADQLTTSGGGSKFCDDDLDNNRF